MTADSFMLPFLVCYVAAVAFPKPETSYFHEVTNPLGMLIVPSIFTEHLIIRRKAPSTSNCEVLPAPEKVSEAIITQTEAFTSDTR
jgi:hypothetical protein